ncbi:MAG: hypothetical protein IJH88_00915 [Eggerthellaceae bacterium]|nr:hypothetical protein [Eggerthellaceae bacterium]
MKLGEVFEKIGRDKLKEAMECDDAEALQKLLNAHGVTLSDEQVDFIAGGRWLSYDTKLGFSCFSDEYYEELMKKYANQHN